MMEVRGGGKRETAEKEREEGREEGEKGGREEDKGERERESDLTFSSLLCSASAYSSLRTEAPMRSHLRPNLGIHWERNF